MTEVPSIPMSRGAIIICDYVEKMVNGKWLIAGTHSAVDILSSEMVTNGIPCYIRFQPEMAGAHTLTVRIFLRDAPSNHPPIHLVKIGLTIENPNHPVEMGIRTPPFGIACPVDYESLLPGRGVVVHLTVWAELDGCPLGTSPLDIRFIKPKGLPHDYDDGNADREP